MDRRKNIIGLSILSVIVGVGIVGMVTSGTRSKERQAAQEVCELRKWYWSEKHHSTAVWRANEETAKECTRETQGYPWDHEDLQKAQEAKQAYDAHMADVSLAIVVHNALLEEGRALREGKIAYELGYSVDVIEAWREQLNQEIFHPIEGRWGNDITEKGAALVKQLWSKAFNKYEQFQGTIRLKAQQHQ